MKTFLTILFLLLFAVPAAAQLSPLNLRYDVARYYGDTENLYLELYYGFDVSSLGYRAENGTMSGEAIVTCMVKRSANDSIVAQQGWRIPFSVADTSMLKQSRMYADIFGFMLPPDIYRVYLSVSDYHDPSMNDSLSFLMDVKPFTPSSVSISDVELAASIVPMERDSTNRFYKNSFEVRPNPAKMYGAHQPVLFYYLEAYNLKSKSSEYYQTRAMVTNAVGKEMLKQEKMRRRVNNSSVEVGKMNLSTLKSGTYFFSFSVIDTADGTSVTSTERFNVHNPALPMDTLINPSGINIDATEYATMSESDVQKEFEQARYIATKSELDQFKQLSGVEAKRKALHEFWLKRDDDLGTPENDFKKEYFKRVAESNAQYKTGFREGWKTDRGRVYIVYGAPDEVERHANEIDVKPYEIWSYNRIQGGVVFIFGDRTGFSDYVLIHSTHRSEIHDENWRRQIQGN